MWKPIAACLALGGVSLLLPSEPSYDPLAWLIWGRELAHFQLDTNGGPSWKPLPVVLTTLIAPLDEVDHGLPPALWMVVARAGALLALVMAFRLARRLGGTGAAGVVAAVALFLTPDWLQFTAHGSEAPLAVALMLWAIERHLDERPGHALALGTLACLLRPELVPFLGLYGLWAWRAAARLRPALIGVLVLLPAAWAGPEWLGSGMPLDAGAQARSEPAWSLSLAEHPWLRALQRVHNHAGLTLELLAAVAVAAAALRREAATLVLAAAALAEAGLFVAMTQAGFSGNPRYVLPALTILAVLAGAGAAVLARGFVEFPAHKGAKSTSALRAAAVAALLGAAVAVLPGRVAHLQAEASEVAARMQLHRDLSTAVRAAGGPASVRRLGWATTNRALQTRLAWELGVPMEQTESLTAYRVVFRSSRELLVGRVYLTGRPRRRQTLARVGSFRVYRRDRLTFPFTGLLQGIHTRDDRGRTHAPRVVTR
jgi:hypothetical protein